MADDSKVSKVYKVWKGLPTWAKGIVAVAVTGLSIYGGYRLVKFIDRKNQERDTNAVADDAKDEYKKLSKAGEKLSYNDTKYTSTANTVQKLLDGCETPATEVEVANNIISAVKKPIDWYYLVKVFGSREIEDCVAGKTTYDLVSLVKDQLDSTFPGTNKTTLNYLELYLKKIGVTL